MSKPAEEFVKEWRSAQERIRAAISAVLADFEASTGAEVREVNVGLERIVVAVHGSLPDATVAQVRWVQLAIGASG